MAFLSRNRGWLVGAAVLALIVAVQWPMFKGVFYRATAASAPAGNIKWRTDFEAAKKEAQSSGKPLLVDFYADWCPPCQVMKREVWPDEQVGKLAMDHYIPVLIDVDQNGALAERYGIRTIPTVMVMDAEGKVQQRAGPLGKDAMVDFLKKSKE